MNSAILVRRLLLFDIFADDIKGSAPATATEITGGPKRISPEFFRNRCMVPFPNDAARNAFETVDKDGNRYFGRVVNK